VQEGKTNGGGGGASLGIFEMSGSVNDELAQTAARCLEASRSKQFDSINDALDDTLKAIPGDKLAEGFGKAWEMSEAQAGPYKNSGSPTRGFKMDAAKLGIPGASGVLTVRVIPLEMERGKLDFWTVFNDKKKVAGIQILPANTDKMMQQQLEAAAKAQANAAATQGLDEEVTVGAGTPWALPGTLTLPQGTGPFPAVILVHGSGPQDRDETIGANKPFHDLAAGLSAKGVAVLRYEKRTKQHALEMAGMTTPITVKEETIDDVIEAVKLLQGNKKIDGKRIVVLGHSLGGMLIPRIAQAGGNIAGFIVMAGNVRQIEDLVLAQTTYLATLNGKPTPDEQKKIAEAQALVDQVKGLKPGVKSSLFIMGASPEYWLDLRGYDPALAAKAITKPLLVLQGERDYQVTVEDFKRWQAALNGQPNFTAKLYPGLNHLFILGQGKSIPSEYNVPGHMAPTVTDDIAAWVKQLK
jgi:dienelactone hydrolase